MLKVAKSILHIDSNAKNADEVARKLIADVEHFTRPKKKSLLGNYTDITVQYSLFDYSSAHTILELHNENGWHISIHSVNKKLESYLTTVTKIAYMSKKAA